MEIRCAALRRVRRVELHTEWMSECRAWSERQGLGDDIRGRGTTLAVHSTVLVTQWLLAVTKLLSIYELHCINDRMHLPSDYRLQCGVTLAICSCRATSCHSLCGTSIVADTPAVLLSVGLLAITRCTCTHVSDLTVRLSMLLDVQTHCLAHLGVRHSNSEWNGWQTVWVTISEVEEHMRTRCLSLSHCVDMLSVQQWLAVMTDTLDVAALARCSSTSLLHLAHATHL